MYNNVIHEQSAIAASDRLEETFTVPNEMDGALILFRKLLADYEQAHPFNMRWMIEAVRESFLMDYVATEMALGYYRSAGYTEAAAKAEARLADCAKRWHIAHALCVYFKWADIHASSMGLAEYFKQRRAEDVKAQTDKKGGT